MTRSSLLIFKGSKPSGGGSGSLTPEGRFSMGFAAAAFGCCGRDIVTGIGIGIKFGKVDSCEN